MKIHLIVGQRVETYDGEYAPEVLDAWDENTLDENRDGFREAFAKHEGDKGLAMVRELIVDVMDADIERLFKVPVVKAKTESEDPEDYPCVCGDGTYEPVKDCGECGTNRRRCTACLDYLW